MIRISHLENCSAIKIHKLVRTSVTHIITTLLQTWDLPGNENRHFCCGCKEKVAVAGPHHYNHSNRWDDNGIEIHKKEICQAKHCFQGDISRNTITHDTESKQ